MSDTGKICCGDIVQRRDFIKIQAAGLACAATGILGFPVRLLAASPYPYIAIVKGSPEAATREAINLLGGMPAFVKTGQKVVIKPNMSFNASEASATNSHPIVVATILAMCLEAGAASVLILDHAFGGGSKSMRASGIMAACDAIRPGLCRNLGNSRDYAETNLEKAREMRHNAIMKDVLAADVLISVPVAKAHSSTGVSLALKGQMGLVLDRNSMHSRYDLDTAIVDLADRLKPDLTVIDAIRVLSSNGPMGPGKILAPGEIIASRDPVAADAMAVASFNWYGRSIQPRQVAHIARAHARGLGRMDIENLNVKRIAI